MFGISHLVIELSALGMFNSVSSVDFKSISKDHIGEVKVNFQGETIQESVYSQDDAFSVAERIIKKSSFK